MKNAAFGILTLAVAAVGVATGSSIAQAKTGLPVVAGAQSISKAEKAGINGECGCPAPSPDPTPAATKPGYGFGAKTPHYGPPGQGFSPSLTWRDQVQGNGLTPRGNPLPPRAFR